MIKLSNQEELRKMIARYVRGEASNEEITFLQKYYAHFSDHVDGLAELTGREREKIKSQIYKEIRDKIISGEGNTYKFSWSFRIAAAVIAVFVAAGVFWYSRPENESTEEIVVEEPVNPFVIERASGEQRHLYLPDGSYVVLKPGSELNYLRGFTGSIREVELHGQGFFDVRHDAEHPFVVVCGGVRTRVLGTAFTISSYDYSAEFSISVMRGKVEVSNADRQLEVLVKDEQLILDRDTREYVKKQLKSEETAGLSPEYYRMDDITVTQAIDIVEKRWDCTFQVENADLMDCRFTTSFLPTDDLDEVVTVMAMVIGAEFRIKDNVVFLHGEGCKN